MDLLFDRTCEVGWPVTSPGLSIAPISHLHPPYPKKGMRNPAMNEILDEFEVKVGQLVTRFQSMKEDVARLRSENERLLKEAQAAEEMARQNADLQGEMQTLREQIAGYEGKEDVIRNKLRNILDRVEDIEGDIEDLEG